MRKNLHIKELNSYFAATIPATPLDSKRTRAGFLF